MFMNLFNYVVMNIINVVPYMLFTYQNKFSMSVATGVRIRARIYSHFEGVNFVSSILSIVSFKT